MADPRRQAGVNRPRPVLSDGVPASFFPLPASPGDLPHGPMPSPFDELGPAPIARRAAELVMGDLRAGLVGDGIDASVLGGPEGGKMFGVLVVEAPDGSVGFLRAFSGALGGRFEIDGWAPPLFDREARDAFEPAGAIVVNDLLARARAFSASDEAVTARRDDAEARPRHSAELEEMRHRHREARAARRAARAAGAGADDEAMQQLAAQSRRDGAERRGLDARHAAERRGLDERLRRVARREAAFERLRHMVCRHLMRRIHDTYRVRGAGGVERPLRELFAPGEPPGGAGDCAAPRLLAAAFAAGLRPVALAEFWWGSPPPGGGRVAGAFYPACRDKCGPLLPFLLDGLDVEPPRRFAPADAADLPLRILHEDARVVVVDKPAGLLSVPGRGPRLVDSVQWRLQRAFPGLRVVHRLDLDTSGLLVAARDDDAYVALQRQFSRRDVEKRYVALVDGTVKGEEGVIEFAMRVDVDDRPRQVRDDAHGKPAVTRWRVLSREAGVTRVAFFPETGRTHQIRVHAAHPGGLGVPIVGDRLYGREGPRLMLHAEELSFVHPSTAELLHFTSVVPF